MPTLSLASPYKIPTLSLPYPYPNLHCHFLPLLHPCPFPILMLPYHYIIPTLPLASSWHILVWVSWASDKAIAGVWGWHLLSHMSGHRTCLAIAFATHYLLPTTYYLLPTTHYPLPTTQYPLPIAYYTLHNTYSLLFIVHHILISSITHPHTTYYLATSCLRAPQRICLECWHGIGSTIGLAIAVALALALAFAWP